jgi:hypothetical protein
MAIGLRPLNDQQVAGFVSKLTMLFTLLTVGAVVLARASRNEDELGENDPLVWADVERQFERVDRRGIRPEGAEPGPSTDSPPGPDRSEHTQGGADPGDREPPDA